MATAAAGKFYSAAANSCKGVRKQPRRVLRAGEALRQLHHQGCWRDFVRASAAPSSSGSPPFGPVDVSKLEGYTPYIYISYADRQSRTSARVTVNASADECFAIWYDRANHFKFLTLAEQIGYENDDSKLAMYMLFYRWGMSLPYSTPERWKCCITVTRTNPLSQLRQSPLVR